MDGEVSAIAPARHRYRTTDVAVSGGALRVGVWDPLDPPLTTIVAVHGVTASHLAWQWLVDALPGVRVIAPDLRGRGRSAEVSGPAGMAAHADDLAEVFLQLDVTSAPVVGHSMGAFVAMVFAHRHPERVSHLFLVDGGMPLATPVGLTTDEIVDAILGPTAARLRMRFADLEAYLGFWEEHPAFRGHSDERLRAYFAYDLTVDADGDADGVRPLRPATSYAVTAEDTVDLTTGTSLQPAWDQLGEYAGSQPVDWVTVSLGLRAEPPGLYAHTEVQRLERRYPAIASVRWDDLNHYTVVMSDAGAGRIADRLRRRLWHAG